MTYGTLRGEAKVEKRSDLKTIQNMMNFPEETSYQERVMICRQEEIWQERHLHMFEAIEAKEEGPEREEELKRFWWAFKNENFTLMYGREMDAVVNQKSVLKRLKEQGDKLKKLKLWKKKTSPKKRKVPKKRIITRKT